MNQNIAASNHENAWISVPLHTMPKVMKMRMVIFLLQNLSMVADEQKTMLQDSLKKLWSPQLLGGAEDFLKEEDLTRKMWSTLLQKNNWVYSKKLVEDWMEKAQSSQMLDEKTGSMLLRIACKEKNLEVVDQWIEKKVFRKGKKLFLDCLKYGGYDIAIRIKTPTLNEIETVLSQNQEVVGSGVGFCLTPEECSKITSHYRVGKNEMKNRLMMADNIPVLNTTKWSKLQFEAVFAVLQEGLNERIKQATSDPGDEGKLGKVLPWIHQAALHGQWQWACQALNKVMNISFKNMSVMEFKELVSLKKHAEQLRVLHPQKTEEDILKMTLLKMNVGMSFVFVSESKTLYLPPVRNTYSSSGHNVGKSQVSVADWLLLKLSPEHCKTWSEMQEINGIKTMNEQVKYLQGRLTELFPLKKEEGFVGGIVSQFESWILNSTVEVDSNIPCQDQRESQGSVKKLKRL